MLIIVVEMFGFIALVLHYVAAHTAKFDNYQVANFRQVPRRVRFADEAIARGARGLNARPRPGARVGDGGAFDFAQPEGRWRQQPLPPRDPLPMLGPLVEVPAGGPPVAPPPPGAPPPPPGVPGAPPPPRPPPPGAPPPAALDAEEEEGGGAPPVAALAAIEL